VVVTTAGDILFVIGDAVGAHHPHPRHSRLHWCRRGDIGKRSLQTCHRLFRFRHLYNLAGTAL